jgi:hypothetical protein
MKATAMSDCLVVAMTSAGRLLVWPMTTVMAAASHSTAAGIAPALVIENEEPAWRSLVLADTRLIFGLEVNLGDLKVFSFCSRLTKSTAVEADNENTSSTARCSLSSWRTEGESSEMETWSDLR